MKTSIENFIQQFETASKESTFSQKEANEFKERAENALLIYKNDPKVGLLVKSFFSDFDNHEYKSALQKLKNINSSLIDSSRTDN